MPARTLGTHGRSRPSKLKAGSKCSASALLPSGSPPAKTSRALGRDERLLLCDRRLHKAHSPWLAARTQSLLFRLIYSQRAAPIPPALALGGYPLSPAQQLSPPVPSPSRTQAALGLPQGFVPGQPGSACEPVPRSALRRTRSAPVRPS